MRIAENAAHPGSTITHKRSSLQSRGEKMDKALREADLKGPTAQAWKMTPSEESKLKPHSQLGGFLVEGIPEGRFHPFWNRWAVLMIHLRDVEGLPPAELDNDKNTHEFMIFSLEPGKLVDPDSVGPGSLPIMSPADAIVQFACDSDEQAIEVLEAAVKVIIDGYASPDSDNRRWWNACIPNTVEHIRFNGHSTPGKVLQ